MARLLRGEFSYPAGEAFATNGFEDLPNGTVTDLTVGVQMAGDCEWGQTIWVQR